MKLIVPLIKKLQKNKNTYIYMYIPILCIVYRICRFNLKNAFMNNIEILR